MDLEKSNELIEVGVPALMLMAVHGNLRLALRHPENKGPSRELTEDFIELAEEAMKEVGLIDDEDIRNIHDQEKKSERRIILPGEDGF